jgi:putative transposase
LRAKNQAQLVILSPRQEKLLRQIVSKTTNSYRLVRRAKIILGAASGESNSSVSRKLELDRRQVRMWRKKWLSATEILTEAELRFANDAQILKLITEILADAPRRGTPKHFTVEQAVQIVAIACESPSESLLPLSHWTASALATEAIKRKIVDKISPRSVGRFLKGSYTTTTSSSLLVKSQN